MDAPHETPPSPPSPSKHAASSERGSAATDFDENLAPRASENVLRVQASEFSPKLEFNPFTQEFAQIDSRHAAQIVAEAPVPSLALLSLFRAYPSQFRGKNRDKNVLRLFHDMPLFEAKGAVACARLLEDALKRSPRINWTLSVVNSALWTVAFKHPDPSAAENLLNRLDRGCFRFDQRRIFLSGSSIAGVVRHAHERLGLRDAERIAQKGLQKFSFEGSWGTRLPFPNSRHPKQDLILERTVVVESLCSAYAKEGLTARIEKLLKKNSLFDPKLAARAYSSLFKSLGTEFRKRPSELQLLDRMKTTFSRLKPALDMRTHALSEPRAVVAERVPLELVRMSPFFRKSAHVAEVCVDIVETSVRCPELGGVFFDELSETLPVEDLLLTKCDSETIMLALRHPLMDSHRLALRLSDPIFESKLAEDRSLIGAILLKLCDLVDVSAHHNEDVSMLTSALQRASKTHLGVVVRDQLLIKRLVKAFSKSKFGAPHALRWSERLADVNTRTDPELLDSMVTARINDRLLGNFSKTTLPESLLKDLLRFRSDRLSLEKLAKDSERTYASRARSSSVSSKMNVSLLCWTDTLDRALKASAASASPSNKSDVSCLSRMLDYYESEFKHRVQSASTVVHLLDVFQISNRLDLLKRLSSTVKANFQNEAGLVSRIVASYAVLARDGVERDSYQKREVFDAYMSDDCRRAALSFDFSEIGAAPKERMLDAAELFGDQELMTKISN